MKCKESQRMRRNRRSHVFDFCREREISRPLEWRLIVDQRDFGAATHRRTRPYTELLWRH